MNFEFDERPSDSPFVDLVWRTHSERGGAFTSIAFAAWEIVVTRQCGKSTLTVRGPETIATPAPIPEDAEFFGIVFKVGTFMHPLPTSNLVDDAVNLPDGAGASFWLNGGTWQFPDYENADTFVDWLERDGLLAHDSIVDAVLQNRPTDVSPRTAQRRFRDATGLTHSTVAQIERARRANELLQRGRSILDVVYEMGYADQPHLTRSMRRFMGQTPAQISHFTTDK